MDAKPPKKFKFKKIEAPKDKLFEEEDDSFLLSAMEGFEAGEKQGLVTSTPVKIKKEEVKGYASCVDGYKRSKKDGLVIEVDKPKKQVPKPPTVSPILQAGSASYKMQDEAKKPKTLSQPEIIRIFGVLAKTENPTDPRLLELASDDNIEEYLKDVKERIDVALIAKKFRQNGLKLNWKCKNMLS